MAHAKQGLDHRDWDRSRSRSYFRAAARPLGREGDRNAWYLGRWRVMAIDGLHLDEADTASNETAFARPGHSRGAGSAYPQVRVVALAETGTADAYVGVTIGGCRQGEPTLARDLLPHLDPGMLCLADRNFFGYDLWRAVNERTTERLRQEEPAAGPRAPRPQASPPLARPRRRQQRAAAAHPKTEKVARIPAGARMPRRPHPKGAAGSFAGRLRGR